MSSPGTHRLRLVLATSQPHCAVATIGCRQAHTAAGEVPLAGPGSAGFEPPVLRAAPTQPRRPDPSVDHTNCRSEEKSAGAQTAAAAAAAAAADTAAQTLGAVGVGPVGAGTNRPPAREEPSARLLGRPTPPHALF
eukprot:COSAG02_NODE_3717_length_6328_cov_6.689517_4_plen_136_part_00